MRIFTGHTDVELTELGQRQVERSAEYILENYRIDKIYSSDLIRAVNTAKCVADKTGLEIIKTERLRELYAGHWDGAPFDEINNNYADDWNIWREDIGNSRCSGGESIKELGERILSVLTDIAEQNDGKTVLISTHATPIRVTQCLIKGLPLVEMKNIPWGANASITVLEYDNGRWTIIKESYDEHLAEIKTSLPADV